MPSANIWIAASDGDIVSVGKFLAQDPSAVNAHDENGYTPIHATVSYGHISLLKSLIRTHGGNVNVEDHDGDTPLFAAETVEVAKVLVEELGANVDHTNSSGMTAADSIEEDGSFPLVAAYLRDRKPSDPVIPKPPPGVSVNLSAEEDVSESLPPVDEALRQRIQEMASRANFESEETQRELRELITQAVQEHVIEPDAVRNIRQRQDGASS